MRLRTISAPDWLPSIYQTREEWLRAGVKALAPWYESNGYPIPATVQVSCGLPHIGAFSAKSKRIGECWSPKASADHRTQIFVSPVLDDPEQVLDVLCHELVHAIVGNEAGHKAPFTRAARACGLTEGKPTSASAGDELRTELARVSKGLGTYPHGALRGRPSKKQSTRMLKVLCPDCGYTVRTTAKWIEVGLPVCPCGSDMVEG